jgi:hypothetical protein
VLAAVISYYRERSEQAKWHRTLDLEERRIRHEENKWVLELNNQRELELHKMRLRTYPEVFAALGLLSHYHIAELTADRALQLADRLNQWGYGEQGLCMLPDTRDALLVLREYLEALAQGHVGVNDIMAGPRTDLIELMRRDFVMLQSNLEIPPERDSIMTTKGIHEPGTQTIRHR